MANQITEERWLKSEIKGVLQAAGHSTPGAIDGSYAVAAKQYRT
jgi:hypothetical protein